MGIGRLFNSDNIKDAEQRANQTVVFKPYPKQELFLSSEVDELCFGGARGGSIVTGKQIGRAHV